MGVLKFGSLCLTYSDLMMQVTPEDVNGTPFSTPAVRSYIITFEVKTFYPFFVFIVIHMSSINLA